MHVSLPIFSRFRSPCLFFMKYKWKWELSLQKEPTVACLNTRRTITIRKKLLRLVRSKFTTDGFQSCQIILPLFSIYSQSSPRSNDDGERKWKVRLLSIISLSQATTPKTKVTRGSCTVPFEWEILKQDEIFLSFQPSWQKAAISTDIHCHQRPMFGHDMLYLWYN